MKALKPKDRTQTQINADLKLMADDAHYFGATGSQYLSKSRAGSLLGDVREFLAVPKDNINFTLGSYLHHLLIEPEKAVIEHQIDSSTRGTKKYKEFVAELGLDFVPLTSEVENIEACAAAMLAIPQMADIIYGIENQYEVPYIGELAGYLWKGKVDIETPTQIIDIKSTGDISRFVSSAYKYNYDMQAYVYEQLTGKALTFFVVCKKSNSCGIYGCSDNFLLSGQNKVERAIEAYENYYGENATQEPKNYFITKTL
jgi:hypothetical protein